MSDISLKIPNTVNEVATAMAANPGMVLMAGGTDLLPMLKEDLVQPSGLIALERVAGLRGIREEAGELVIGALATLAEIAAHPAVRQGYTALAEACRLAASPQLRNMGTIGGNLMQQTRCWYFRGPVKCWMKGGEWCYARQGENDYHSIFLTAPEQSKCVSAHPSDPAPALMALGAHVRYLSGGETVEVPVEDLYALPEPDRRGYWTLPAGAIITGVLLPEAPPGGRSLYLKAMSRAAWSFALAGLAVALDYGAPQPQARIALSGVAPVPIRARLAEEYLGRTPRSDVKPEALADAVLDGAAPLEHNVYKVDLLRGLVLEAWRQLSRP